MEPIPKEEHDNDPLEMDDDPIQDPEDIREGDPEEDTEEDPVEDCPETKIDTLILVMFGTSDPIDDEVGWRDVHMYPLPIDRPPIPPAPPLSPVMLEDEYDFTYMDQGAYEADNILSSNPDSPTSPQTIVHMSFHEWIIGQLTTNLAVANARIAELRGVLDAERASRIMYYHSSGQEADSEDRPWGTPAHEDHC